MNLYHSPELFQKNTRITAGITYAGRDQINKSGEVPGLNLGDNTNAPASEVESNFNKLSASLKCSTNEIALAKQVHGSEVQIVERPGFYKNVDGLITSKNNLVIASKVADCAAILLSDSSSDIIGAVHAGWRGAAADILPKALEKLLSTGADFQYTSAYISPCISLKNFEVGEEVADKFDPMFINREIGMKPHLDLKSFLKHQLLAAGITEERIEVDSRCTFDEQNFYSYRRERDKAGRMLAFIRCSSN